MAGMKYSVTTLRKRIVKALQRLSYYRRTGYWHCWERVNPDFPDENFQNHFKVYQFVLQLARNRSVLDVGCGTGYGAAHLSSVAKQVVGIDISRSAIYFSKTRYRRQNLTFVVMDAQKLSFADATFDLIVSTETFEHLYDQPGHLREAFRVPKPGGVCFIATPNPELFVGIRNPYHTKENTYKELQMLLAESSDEFCIVENSLPPSTVEGTRAREARWAAGHHGVDPAGEVSVLGMNLDCTHLHNTHSFFCFARKALD
jgi:SAM-dependent methyltransferase